jgi:peptidoglycan/xylan/chitin deacetylase (PgdA/CDA1 family)
MYHRVLPVSSFNQTYSNSAIIVSTKTFEKHVDFLKKNLDILSLDEFEQHLNEHGSYPSKSCLITFDDGWFDNYEYALPVLAKHGVPATIFLPYNYIGTSKRFWQEELTAALHTICDDQRNEVTEFLNSLPYRIIQSDKDEMLSSHINECIRHIKKLTDQEIDDILENARHLAAQLSKQQSNIDTYLNWDNVKGMMEKHIAFGSHCLSHRILTGLSKNKMTAEIDESKAKIEAIIDTPVKSIAYPNGNYNDDVLKTAQTTGYTLGFSTVSTLVDHTTNRYAIPRINIHDAATKHLPLFYCRLLKIL